MGDDKGTGEQVKREYGGLAGYCSRLAGENMCRCGGSPKSRYCLWTHYPPPPSFDKRPKKGD